MMLGFETKFNVQSYKISNHYSILGWVINQGAKIGMAFVLSHDYPKFLVQDKSLGLFCLPHAHFAHNNDTLVLYLGSSLVNFQLYSLIDNCKYIVRKLFVSDSLSFNFLNVSLDVQVDYGHFKIVIVAYCLTIFTRLYLYQINGIVD